MTIYVEFWLTVSIFTRPDLQTPPLYLYIVKIEKFHPILTVFLRAMFCDTTFLGQFLDKSYVYT